MEGELLPSSSHYTVPSPRYSEGDYQPLSTIETQTASQGVVSSPPREKRKLMSRPGKVMKPAYFKGIQWTRVFVAGPLDPFHNKKNSTVNCGKRMCQYIPKELEKSSDTTNPKLI